MTTQTYDRIVHRALSATRAPGAALVVVDGDTTIVRGYGLRRLGSDDPVTADTVFALASVSKAFTATACGLCVDDGTLSWDDPIRKHLPAFRLHDPAADTNATIRDLLCHRTGLPRHDALWYHTRTPRAELLARMAHLEPAATFRGTYQYNNLCYLVAGEAVAAAAKTPFEAFVRTRLLAPLGMGATSFCPDDAVATGNYATPHRTVRGTVTPLDTWLDFTNVGPCGAMNASAADLAYWLRFQLSGGLAPDGIRLLSEAALSETHRPQMIQPIDDDTRSLYPDRIQQSYGLGWVLYDWNGQPVLSHGGAIDGFRSHCALLPRQGVGFAILTNLPGYLPEIVRNSLLDGFLSRRRRAWTARFQAKAREEKEKERRERREKDAARHRGTRPSLALDGYTGTYDQPGYGRLIVTLTEGRLATTWSGQERLLRHWHHDTFVTEGEPPGWSPRELTFALNARGTATAVTFVDQIFRRL